MLDHLDKYRILLGSQSPRRKELLKQLGLIFDVPELPFVDESYPDSLSAMEVASYLASKKADAYTNLLTTRDLLITADTIVCLENEVMGKPAHRAEACGMLTRLSGREHVVYTGVCVRTLHQSETFVSTTRVRFSNLTEEEIAWYVDQYKPFDKAGSYGIQEWIGSIAVVGIEGSYFNVMGLPVQQLYSVLKGWKDQ